MKRNTKYFQVSEKEQEPSPWEASAGVMFMHELVTGEVHRLLHLYVLQCSISDVSFVWLYAPKYVFTDEAVQDVTGSLCVDVFGLCTDIFQMYLHVCMCKNKEAQKLCFMIWYIPFFPSSLPCSCISTFDGSCWIRPRSLKD